MKFEGRKRRLGRFPIYTICPISPIHPSLRHGVADYGSPLHTREQPTAAEVRSARTPSSWVDRKVSLDDRGRSIARGTTRTWFASFPEDMAAATRASAAQDDHDFALAAENSANCLFGGAPARKLPAEPRNLAPSPPGLASAKGLPEYTPTSGRTAPPPRLATGDGLRGLRGGAELPRSPPLRYTSSVAAIAAMSSIGPAQSPAKDRRPGADQPGGNRKAQVAFARTKSPGNRRWRPIASSIGHRQTPRMGPMGPPTPHQPLTRPPAVKTGRKVGGAYSGTIHP